MILSGLAAALVVTPASANGACRPGCYPVGINQWGGTHCHCPGPSYGGGGYGGGWGNSGGGWGGNQGGAFGRHYGPPRPGTFNAAPRCQHPGQLFCPVEIGRPWR